MRVEIEQYSGFCFGVENAIKLTEQALLSGEEIYSLGHIVHNEAEVKRLEKLGLKTINHEQFSKLRNAKVVIRAHGEPPGTYAIARKNNIEIIEATCPIVKRIQQKIRRHYEETGGKVQNIIFGKKEHAEVIGLLGQTGGNSILVSDLEDIAKIDYSRPAEIFSQTTRSREKYAEIISEIRKAYENAGHEPARMLEVNNTICGQVANREPVLEKFCASHEVIVFVSGKSSSNGRMLFDVCSRINSETYFISDTSEIKDEWFDGVSSVGVCGATSTPKWLIKKVAERIEMTGEREKK
ncbi:MAG: 4-hydroxy-3-methylbut-2-enyl diphosphate reductase [Bacteroidales bacterium]|jgi:4-hydroxy-3-methylbut-2-enyl diphosphate reductase|nr:4-hydroxy-3-methylbut-2-enyl diphosphate reductase [Bacteroidales bacterium]